MASLLRNRISGLSIFSTIEKNLERRIAKVFPKPRALSRTFRTKTLSNGNISYLNVFLNYIRNKATHKIFNATIVNQIIKDNGLIWDYINKNLRGRIPKKGREGEADHIIPINHCAYLFVKTLLKLELNNTEIKVEMIKETLETLYKIINNETINIRFISREENNTFRTMNHIKLIHGNLNTASENLTKMGKDNTTIEGLIYDQCKYVEKILSNIPENNVVLKEFKIILNDFYVHFYGCKDLPTTGGGLGDYINLDKLIFDAIGEDNLNYSDSDETNNSDKITTEDAKEIKELIDNIIEYEYIQTLKEVKPKSGELSGGKRRSKHYTRKQKKNF